MLCLNITFLGSFVRGNVAELKSENTKDNFKGPNSAFVSNWLWKKALQNLYTKTRDKLHQKIYNLVEKVKHQ